MKSLLTFCAIIVIAGAAQAQHINIGIKGGLNGYTLEGTNSGNFKPKYSFHVGLLGHIHMDSQFAFQPEVVYSVQGAKYKSENNDVFNLNYVNIPLLLQYMFDNGFRLEAGPQFGILSSANTEIGNVSVDVKDNYEKTDVGLAVGMSYVKPSTGFGFDIRYNYGLTNINKSAPGDAFNRGFQFGIFYLFQHRS